VDAGGLLATNAHIVGALQKRGALPPKPGEIRALAVQSDSYEAREITSASAHPTWREGSIRSDVGLLRLAPGAKLVPLRLAADDAVAALQRGAPLAAFGFPAVSTDPMRPRGRLSVDVVGDVRGEYLEVGLGIAPGTSGSPVFDSSGTVVAIVAGGDFVDAPTGVRPTGSAANWALRAGAISELLQAGR
jgi:S1-C subfamily serine protease